MLANALEWRNVYSKNGGEYNLTIGFICGESRNIAVSILQICLRAHQRDH